MLYFVHLIGLLLVALISLVAAWWVRKQTRDRAGTAMIVVLSIHGVMAVAAFVQFLGSDASWQVFWVRLWTSFGFVSSAPWLVLAIYYTGHERWLTKPVWLLILVGPVVPIVIWITDPIHGFAVTEYAYETEPFARAFPQYSDGGLVLYSLMSVYVLFAFGLFLRVFLFPRRRSRWQAGTVLVGMTAIYVTMGITEAGFLPAPGFPYGLYGIGIFGSLVAIALFRTQFFGVTPLAHETIFEAIDDAIVVVDARRAIVDCNDAAIDLFPDLAHRIGDTVDEAYPALLSPTDASSPDGGGATAIVEQLDGTHDTPFAGAVRVSSADESRTLRIGVSEIATGTEPRGYALIMRDVTELERYATDLEHKTDQLERFASVLSHDLRNPLSIASGYVDLTRETDELEHLDDVDVALERIEETIDDLLTLSREGESIDETDDVQFRSLVTEAWTTSDTRTVTLENDVDPEYRIRADPSRARTLLENLYRNAADHGAETVWVEHLESGPGFAVADDGPGIPEDERDRVFEYGYSSTDEGTGLGLSIVSSIATAHRWTVSVTESDAGGAQFEVTDVDRVYPNEREIAHPESDLKSEADLESIPGDDTDPSGRGHPSPQ